MSVAAETRRVRVEHIMGTAIGVDLREPYVDEAVLDALFAWLRSVDERFSTYRDDSLVSRVRRGELRADDTDDDFREVLRMCDAAHGVSNGAFDAWRCDPGGLDPSGLVKGWSIDRGARILDSAGARNYCINAGGDVLARGSAAPGSPWRVGIRHPFAGDRVAAVLAARDLAVATSGAYERGDHVTNPATGLPAEGLLSFTVAGPSLAFADAYATAGFALGPAALDWMTSLTGYEAMAITAAERVVSTRGFERLRLS